MEAGDKVGDYVIEKPISVGKTGQADIYRARRDDGSGSPVAVKILADHLKSDKRSLKNFEEEAELLTKLDHKNIVRIEAFNTSPPTPYIAQEYIEGQSLAELLKQSVDPLSFEMILDIALQVTDALSYAHNLEYFRIKETKNGGKSSRRYRGITHRDLSTDNILITENGQIKLIDFGIARAVGVATVTMTAAGIGKEFYIAPEVELGSEEKFAPTVDVYSFGVCLYELVMTGRPKKGRLDVLRQYQTNLHHLYGAFPDDVPEEFKRTIVDCVRRESKDRPQTMEQVREPLLQLQKQLAYIETAIEKIPEGLVVRSQVLTFERLLRLNPEAAGDLCIRVALSEDEARILLLCDRQAKVQSFNLSGGEKMSYFVPRGKRLTALAGIKGAQALGMLADREGLQRLDERGEWHTVTGAIDGAEPRTVPDNLILLGDSVYVGDYAGNRIIRIQTDDSTLIGATSAGYIGQLGPFGIGGDGLLCIDMTTKELLKIDFELKHIEKAAFLADYGWPTCLVIKDDLSFIIDSQNRNLSILAHTGDCVEADALRWRDNLAISQVIFGHKTSTLIALETSMPALLFFQVGNVDLEVVRLAGVLRDLGVKVSDLSYRALENAVRSFIETSGDKKAFILRLIDKLKKTPGTGQKGVRLQVSLYSLLPTIVPQEERQKLLRDVAQAVEKLGDLQTAKRLYLEYLREPHITGYDPEVRDRYGRLLETEEKWEEIIDFEGPFLSSAYFNQPGVRVAYERSFQRLRSTYTKMGIPVPKHLQVPPTEDLARARSLLQNREYEKAAAMLAKMIEDEAYKQMEPVDAVAMLTGYAQSIKLRLRTMTVEDWQSVYRALSILVRDYSGQADFDPQYKRDLAAARNQIERLEGSIPTI